MKTYPGMYSNPEPAVAQPNLSHWKPNLWPMQFILVAPRWPNRGVQNLHPPPNLGRAAQVCRPHKLHLQALWQLITQFYIRLGSSVLELHLWVSEFSDELPKIEHSSLIELPFFLSGLLLCGSTHILKKKIQWTMTSNWTCNPVWTFQNVELIWIDNKNSSASKIRESETQQIKSKHYCVKYFLHDPSLPGIGLQNTWVH
jgi:hypothetical protein